MRKEEIDKEKIKGKIAVVFDVLLATSAITIGLEFGAKAVIPVLNSQQALDEAKLREKDSFILVGEDNGVTLDGFLDLSPVLIKDVVRGKTMILSTTNGTIAICNASKAKEVYIASLLNSEAVALNIQKSHFDETIVVICSGSRGNFCIEDFYGAGYFINILNERDNDWVMTESAQTALDFYKNNCHRNEQLLCNSRTAKFLEELGFLKDVEFVAQRSIYSTIPYLKENKFIVNK
jgi:2-phosphosulfolactate phosphatase